MFQVGFFAPVFLPSIPLASLRTVILSSTPPRSPPNPVMEEQLPTRHALAALDVVYEMSTVLDTGLSKSELAILMGLCENSVNPEALAAVVCRFVCFVFLVLCVLCVLYVFVCFWFVVC